jgi:hypothetical protein
MSGIILRWLGGGGGDTMCQLLAMDNPNTYINFSTGYSDHETGRTVLQDSESDNYSLISRLDRADPISDKEKLKEEFLKLIKEHKRFIIKFHNFDHEFDNMLKEHIDINDLGFDLKFLPFIIQANIEKFSNTQHPMYDLKYRYNSNLDKTLEKIGQKLNEHQKRQVLTWSMISHAIKCMKEFRLDKAPIKTQDLFYNNDLIENFFKEKDYKIDLNVPFFSNWKNNNTKYIPSVKYQRYLESKDYNYTNKKDLSIVERYIFLSLAGQNFTFLD